MAELTLPPDYREGPALVYIPIVRHPKDYPLQPGVVGYACVSETPISVEKESDD